MKKEVAQKGSTAADAAYDGTSMHSIGCNIIGYQYLLTPAGFYLNIFYWNGGTYYILVLPSASAAPVSQHDVAMYLRTYIVGLSIWAYG